MRIDWAAEVLRNAKLTVVEEDGWTTRGRDFLKSPLGVVCHHDASSSGSMPKHPSTVINGRPATKKSPAVPGPLSQFYLSRTGAWHLVASGRANHAGTGYYNGFINDCNSKTLGVEAANNGLGELWPEAQVTSYVLGVAALLTKLKAPSLMAFGHKEYAPGRKIDPSFDMDEFRVRVKAQMNELVVPFPGVTQKRTATCRGTAPRWIRKQLGRLGYAVTAGDTFDDSTEKAVMAFRKKQGLKELGEVDQATWALLAMIV